MSPPGVRPLAPADILRCVETLSAALLDDPGWRHVIPEEQPRRAALRAIVRISVREARRHGGGLVAHHEDKILGVALWVPPGRYPLPRLRQLMTAPAMLALAVRVGPERVSRLASFGNSLDSVFPGESVWYLQALGVDPQAQRRGIGSLLLNPVLDRADAAGLPCYLETAKPENVDYYRRFGFALIENGRPLSAGGPTMFRMRRPPHA